MTRERLTRIVNVLLLAAGLALMFTYGYETFKGWQADLANHRALVTIIQYNLKTGKLEMPPPGK